MENGIYFNLPAEEYHALPRLSASGIGNILVSPATYWADSWMNPDRAKAEDEEETKAQQLGKAYHTARLEPDQFKTTYVRDLDPADFPGCLMNGTAIGDALAAIGETKKKAGEDVLSQAMRLKASGYGGPIWHVLRDEFDTTHRDRIPIKAQYYDEIIRDMVRIHDAPDILKHLTDGAPEVSVLWTDKRTGVPMKSRLDYLKYDAFTDFKTFDNFQGKRLEQFIADAFRFNRYYIQAVVYHDAAEEIRGGELKVRDGNAEQQSLVRAIASQRNPLDCWYVFQEKKGIPNLLARKIRLYTKPAAGHDTNDAGAGNEVSEKVAAMTIRRSGLHMKARAEIDHATNLFKFYSEEIGTDRPWPPLEPTGELTDDNFPLSWLETN